MRLNREQKKQAAIGLAKKIAQAKNVIILGFQGTEVGDMTQLRAKLREKAIEMKVVKNSILSRALQTHGYQLSQDILQKPLAVLISLDDEIAPAKEAALAQKEIASLTPLAGIFEGQVVDKEYIMELAKLPSRDELQAKLLSVIRGPISGLQRALQYNLIGLINLIKLKS